MMVNISLDRSYQISDRLKDAASNLLVRQIAKPTLNHVEPGAGSWHKVHMESRMAFEPRFDLGMLVGRVIVHDQMQVQRGRGLAINQFQKLDPLLMAVTIHAGPNDAPFGHLQSSEQGRGPVAFVVVGHGSQSSLDQW